MALELPTKSLFKKSRAIAERTHQEGEFTPYLLTISRANTQPTLIDAGEMLLWERGTGYIYDNFDDTAIDVTKWTTTTTGNGRIGTKTVTETANYQEGVIVVNAGAGSFEFDVETDAIDLPALVDMSEFQFRFTANSGGVGWGAPVKYRTYILGTDFGENAGNNIDNTYQGVKKPNGDWMIYKNGVLNSTITPTNNNIKVGITASGVPVDMSGYTFNWKMYETSVGGSTYLLIKSSQRTFAIDLASF